MGWKWMIRFAYLRESRADRAIDNTELIQTIRKAGIEEHNVYVDTQLDKNDGFVELLQTLEKGDVLLLRSLIDANVEGDIDDLISIMEQLQEKGVLVHSIEEECLYSNFKQIRALVKYYAEKKRLAGYNEALKIKGKIGRKKLVEERAKFIRVYKTGKFSIDEACDMCNLSRSTAFRYLKELKEDNG